LGFADQGVELIEQPDLSDPELDTPSHRQFLGYYKIARHFNFALTHIFNRDENFDSVILVEDDLDVAPDFFEFMAASKKILARDKTLYCASGWNDNGKREHVKDPNKLYRSDFFGGLGWMMMRDLWDGELKGRWAKSFWDDWFRNPEQRRGRSCIRPEVSRTRTFGKIGVSRGQFFDKYLKFIKLNDEYVPFTEMDVSFLEKSKYDKKFQVEVYEDAVAKTQLELGGISDCGQEYRVEYRDMKQFERIAKSIGIMEDNKAGVPRMGYMGIVSIRLNGCLLHIAPERPWAGYKEN